MIRTEPKPSLLVVIEHREVERYPHTLTDLFHDTYWVFYEILMAIHDNVIAVPFGERNCIVLDPSLEGFIQRIAASHDRSHDIAAISHRDDETGPWSEMSCPPQPPHMFRSLLDEVAFARHVGT